MNIHKLLTTPLGTFLKSFLSIVLAFWCAELANGHDLFSMDIEMIKKMIVAGLIPNVHVLINWLNPQYVGYGVSKIELDMYAQSIEAWRNSQPLIFNDYENLWIIVNCSDCVIEYGLTPIEQNEINTLVVAAHPDPTVFNADKKPYPKGKY